ncbi:hypothetical protein HPB49_015893 [Dermacentor silvarum]|uniref:Uncharacterized protein n=1 Tax=Dermacentor silvarum TaxID=543639 RepID=A0ACB8D6E5_DERSI|nr:hypothetical protein HPB49_015893 [Dermacentor silvarum]
MVAPIVALLECLSQPQQRIFWNTFEELTQEEFRGHFWLSKSTVRWLGEQLEDAIGALRTGGITAKERVFCALRFFAMGTFLRSLGSEEFIFMGQPQMRPHGKTRHPDPRVVGGDPPKLLPRRGLSRQDRALLLRFRIGCCRTAERKHRLSGSGSPLCDRCADVENLDLVLLRCPAHAAERGALVTAYRSLGLPSDSTRALLFPATPTSIARRAFSALLDYLEGTNLSSRL